jgi:hypothetical protein
MHARENGVAGVLDLRIEFPLMGSLPKVPRIAPAEIIARYQAGESVGLLSLRAKIPDYHVTSILCASGVRIRGRAEALRLARQQRPPNPWSRAMRG